MHIKLQTSAVCGILAPLYNTFDKKSSISQIPPVSAFLTKIFGNRSQRKDACFS